MKSRFLLTLAGCALLAGSATAQTRPNTTRGGAPAGGGVFPLPQGVNRVTSIDAHNYILAEEGTAQQRTFSAINVRHLYSGGIAALFGGSSVPTEQFISPGASGAGGAGGNNRGGGRRTGGANVTGFNGGNNGGFNNGGGFNSGGGFNNGGGFNTGGGFGGFGRTSSLGNGMQGGVMSGVASVRPGFVSPVEGLQR